MVAHSAFERRAWERYPIYLAEEKYDNLDDDPQDPRNTSRTLAEELADCYKKQKKKDRTSTAHGVSRTTPAPFKVHTDRLSDPGKRVKAQIGSGFLRKANAAKVGQEKPEDVTSESQTKMSG
ncbi:hypothetical protein AWENTII_010579 [Aspergillus wentii]|nr:hypothetical protein MW887_009749 [Aspergillus wentii]